MKRYIGLFVFSFLHCCGMQQAIGFTYSHKQEIVCELKRVCRDLALLEKFMANIITFAHKKRTKNELERYQLKIKKIKSLYKDAETFSDYFNRLKFDTHVVKIDYTECTVYETRIIQLLTAKINSFIGRLKPNVYLFYQRLDFALIEINNRLSSGDFLP